MIARAGDTQAGQGLRPETGRKLPSRVQWCLSAGFGLLVAALTIRLAWEFATSSTVEAYVTVALSMASVIAIGGAIIYFISKPRRLLSYRVLTAVAAATALGMVGGLAHYIRFVFITPVPPVAKIVATALALASVCGFVALVHAARWVKARDEATGEGTGGRTRERCRGARNSNGSRFVPAPSPSEPIAAAVPAARAGAIRPLLRRGMSPRPRRGR